MTTPLKIAFYPGFFNPIHKGHLQTARMARHQYGFDKIIFAVYNNPPHKSNNDMLSSKDRFEAIAKAIKPYKYMSAIGVQFKDGPPADVYHITKILKDLYKQDRLNLLFGSDAFLFYNYWHKPQEIANIANFYVKPIFSHFNLLQGNVYDRLSIRLANISRKISHFLNIPSYKTVHGEEIRKDIANPQTAKFVPKEALKYIRSVQIEHLPDSYKIAKNGPQMKRYKQRRVTDLIPEVERIYQQDPVMNLSRQTNKTAQ